MTIFYRDTDSHAQLASAALSLAITSASRAQAAADEVGATVATSATLTVNGGPINGKIDAADDLDWFAVSLEAGRGYVFSLTKQVANEFMGMRVVNHFQSMGLVTSVGSDIPYVPAFSGVYYVEVRGGTALRDYSIRVDLPADDYGNSAKMTGQLARGQTLNGRIDYMNDSDYFSMAVDAFSTYQLDFVGAPPYFGYAGVNGTDSVAVETLPGTSVATQVFTAGATGNVLVYIRNPDPGAYSIKASLLSTDDFGNTASTATTLVLGATVNGRIGTDGDVDSFRIVLERGKSYVVKGTGELGTALSVSDITDYSVNSHSGTYTIIPQIDTEVVLYVAAGTNKGNYSLAFYQNVDDVLTGKLDGTRIDAGIGLDTIRYTGQVSDYAVTRAGADFTIAKPASGGATLVNIERVLFSGASALALDIDGDGGAAYRLYRAAFDRTSDKAGVGFWLNALDKGVSLHDVAQAFIGSAEFIALYGSNSSNADFVTLLYANILDRAGDPGGFAYWVNALNNGYSRADVLANFSESDENVDAVALLIGNGFEYIPCGA